MHPLSPAVDNVVVAQRAQKISSLDEPLDPGTLTSSSSHAMGQPARIIHLPRVLTDWPWARAQNPHYEAARAESNAWVQSFNLMSEKRWRRFEACDFSLAAALLWPSLDKSRTRIACDLMNFYFIIDHFSDVGNGEVVQHQADIIHDVLHNPFKPRPHGELPLGEITKQFWCSVLRSGIPAGAAQRFVESFMAYMQGIVQRAKDRDGGRVRTIEEYFRVRRLTIGVRSSLFLLEWADGSGAELPPKFLEHPGLELLVTCVMDMIVLDNDALSYNIEQARGDDAHNLVTILMREMKMDLEGALRWMEGYHHYCERVFLENCQRVLLHPRDGFDEAMCKRVENYVYGLGNWVVGHYTWCFEGQRYFGREGRRVRETGYVHLLPSADRGVSASF